MSANRVTAVRLWAGAAVFGVFALLAWSPWVAITVGYLRWRFFAGDSSWDVSSGGITVNVIEIGLIVTLPLIGNLLIIGEARRHRLARQLRRWHLLAWIASLVSAVLIFQVPADAESWLFFLTALLIPLQLTLLALTHVVLATSRSRAALAEAD